MPEIEKDNPDITKGAKRLYFFFHLIFIGAFYLAFHFTPEISKGPVSAYNYVLCIFFIIVTWLLFFRYIKIFVEHKRSHWILIGAFAAAELTFLVSQIILFATLYKLTGLKSDAPIDKFSYIYFSVMTLTTVGYGDIHPENTARIVAAVQALSGYLYMGIFIGVLTSMIMVLKKDDN